MSRNLTVLTKLKLLGMYKFLKKRLTEAVNVSEFECSWLPVFFAKN